MPLIVTGGAGHWNRTPKMRLHTVKYRLAACADLGKAREIQREAFDWALQVLEHHPALPVRPPKAGAHSPRSGPTASRAFKRSHGPWR